MKPEQKQDVNAPGQVLTYEQLMEVEPRLLTQEQLQQRITITNLKKAERELQIVEHTNAEFQDKKIERQRVAANKTQIIADEHERIEREQANCAHKTGGKGRPGFFAGDGKWGYSITTEILPTSEVYFLCFRCQKEWRMPKKRAVLDGTITLAQYVAQEAEYKHIAVLDKQLFSPDTGEIPGSILFRIPKLEEAKKRDDAEFDEYLREHRRELAQARVGA